MLNLILILMLSYGCLQIQLISCLQCGQKSSIICCSGYTYDKIINMCVECPSGYAGPFCNESCPYPSYGPFCRDNCACDKNECNNIKRCPAGESTDITRTFITSSTMSSHSILMNAMKTFSSNEVDLQFHHDESTSIQTQFSLINKNKEDLKTPIKELIIFLGVLSIVLSILYVASYAVKLNKTPVDTKSIKIELS